MFTAIPHAVLKHPNFVQCSSRAKALLFDLMEQVKFDGDGGWKNNGDMHIAFRCMKQRGWTSRDQLAKAKDELIEARLIVQTRQGGRNQCSLFGITWEPLNRCVDASGMDKFDAGVQPTYQPVVNWHMEPAKTESVSRVTGQGCPV